MPKRSPGLQTYLFFGYLLWDLLWFCFLFRSPSWLGQLYYSGEADGLLILLPLAMIAAPWLIHFIVVIIRDNTTRRATDLVKQDLKMAFCSSSDELAERHPIRGRRYRLGPGKMLATVMLVLYVFWVAVAFTVAGLHYRRLADYYTSAPTENTPWLPGLESPWHSEEFRSRFRSLVLGVAGATLLPPLLCIIFLRGTRRD